MMNCENVIFDLALRYGGHFANINHFSKAVVKQYNLKTYNDINQLLSVNKKCEYQAITKNRAQQMLIENDVQCFRLEYYEDISNDDFSELMEDHAKKVIKFYQSIGLGISDSDIQIFFCDSFPKPFDKNKGIALAPDDYDEIKFGIKKGIYFLNSNTSLYQSRLLIAHEILHHICSKRQPESLARGLEEGLCELLGGYITNSYLFDKPIPEHYIKFRRFKYANPNQKFRLYTDYLRLAALLLKQIGIDGVVEIINSGRASVKVAETTLLHGGTVETSCAARSGTHEKLMREIDLLLLGTIENEVLSPLACYIVNNYTGEKSIAAFAATNSIELKECIDAFDEIQHRIYGCVLDGDSVEFSDLEQLKRNNNVLYECAEQL